jgi:hypothetical protein
MSRCSDLRLPIDDIGSPHPNAGEGLGVSYQTQKRHHNSYSKSEIGFLVHCK